MAAAALVLAISGSPVSAQVAGVNVDYDATFGIPSNAYGGAGAQPGFWNLPTPGITTPLLDLAGAATSWTVTNTTTATFSFDNAGTTGDDQALLDDFLDGTTSITVAGLPGGNYNVFTYAWAADTAAASTNVSVNGLPNQLVGGAWPGTNTLGVTYALHNVTIAGGENINIVTTAGVSFASLNGFQIVPVPEPTSLALLGIPAVAMIWKRRRAK